jgi:hypothetical protein
MENAIGEDMATLEICGELHLVDGDKGGLGLHGHRLDGANRKSGIGGRDLLFTGDQRHIG